MRIRVKIQKHEFVWFRRMAPALCLIPLLAVGLSWAQLKGISKPRTASITTASAPRAYYLTPNAVPGDEALSACASGFHMASVWEIADPSELVYDTELGLVSADNGAGPPTAYELLYTLRAVGWVRTGSVMDPYEPPGQANCWAWNSSASQAEGSTAFLPVNWTAHNQDLGFWEVTTSTCNSPRRVWCIQNKDALFSDGFESGNSNRWSSVF